MNRQSRFKVRFRIQDAWGWCTGMTQSNGMGGEVGGDSGLGTRAHPWRMHIDVWQTDTIL